MRVNVYAEEITDNIEIISKEIEGQEFTGLRIYLELPVTINGNQVSGPFMHHPGDNDSSAVTFWGKKDLREVLRIAIVKLNEHYGQQYCDVLGKVSEEEAEEARALITKPSDKELVETLSYQYGIDQYVICAWLKICDLDKVQKLFIHQKPA